MSGREQAGPISGESAERRIGAAFTGFVTAVGATFEREMDAGRGFLWLPVAFGTGIVVYFALPAEPALSAVAVVATGLVVGAWASRGRVGLHRVLVVLAAIGAGLVMAKVRTDLAVAPVVPHAMTAQVTGWIGRAESTEHGGKRLRISVASIEGLAQENTPLNVRVTVRSGADALRVGDAITLLARLSPPAGPVMPGGYDFALVPFYERIGGVGFAFGAASAADIGPPPLSIQARAPLEHLRETIRLRIVAALPGDSGHIAAALVMGDQRGIAEETHEAMRASGLGHILSISGLHMALVAGSVFWLVRALLALSPALALRYPIKKWAALAALVAATFYLGISGAEVATVRSWVMFAIFLVAILLDRRALTLRNVAIAALIILAFSPESALSISFQMSFAATAALIAVYELIAARQDRELALVHARERTWVQRAGLVIFTLFVTALVAGLATAPFGAFYFQRIAPLTIVANMTVAPAVSLIAMPMALASVVVMPLGLEWIPLWLMQWGLAWMVAVAETTAAWSEGWGGVRALPASALLLMVVGFLWLVLWREPWRIAGVVPISIAIPLAMMAPLPVLIVDEQASAVAVRSGDGTLTILGGRGATFEIENWLRADGDARASDDPSLKAGTACDPVGCVASVPALGIVAFVTRRDGLAEDCRLADVVVTRFAAPLGCDRHALVIDETALALGGATAIYPADNGGTRIETAYPPIRRPFMPPVRE